METAPSSYAAGSIEEERAKAKDRLVSSVLFDRAYNHSTDLKNIRQFHQTQRSLEVQLAELADVANRLGLYDAADFVKKSLAR